MKRGLSPKIPCKLVVYRTTHHQMKVMLLTIGFTVSSFVTMTNNLAARPVRISSGPYHVHLIELFTSEGCSSCPPADRWLGELKDDPELWKSVVPIAWHVTIWDYLGWRDPFGSRQSDSRQQALARLWKRSSVYTPAVAIDGRERKDWWAYHAGYGSARDQQPGRLSATFDDRRLSIQFVPKDPPAASLTATAAILAMGLTSEVARGENRGKRLPHEFVAMETTSTTLKRTATGWETTVELPRFSVDFRGGRAIALWVSQNGIPLQAAGARLD